MARNPDNARRLQLAREHGYSSYYKYREATKGYSERKRFLAQSRGFKNDYQYRKAQKAHPADQRVSPRRSLGGGGQEATYTRTEAGLRAAIRRAAENDLTIYARVTILDENGRTRDVEIWSKGGWRAQDAEDAVDDAGSAFGMIKNQLDALDKYPGPILSVLIRAVAS